MDEHEAQAKRQQIYDEIAVLIVKLGEINEQYARYAGLKPMIDELGVPKRAAIEIGGETKYITFYE